MLASSPTSPGEGERPPIKKSLFNRPSWAKATVASKPETHKEDESFSRSSYMIEKLKQDQAEEQRRKEENVARKKAKKAQRDEMEHTRGARAVKKQRLSDEMDNEEVGKLGEDDGNLEQNGDKDTVLPFLERNADSGPESPPKQSLHQEATALDPKSLTDTIVVDIRDDSDTGSTSQPRQKSPNRAQRSSSTESQEKLEDNVKYFSDEDLSDYTREDRRRRQKASQRSANSPPSANDERNSSQNSSTHPEQSQSDPVVKILITSRIPNTLPLLVHRKASQRLKEVRLTWCRKQDFDQSTTNAVFLTWRKRKIYDVTNCKSLGVVQNAYGEVIIKGDKFGRYQKPTEVEDDETGALLHMEVVTNEIFEQDLKDKESERLKKLGLCQDETVPEVKPARTVPGLRITLKANLAEYSDYKLQVKPTTTFGQILSVFRSQRNVPEEKDIFLMFDGERLGEKQTMQDSEVGDMDAIEVYIK